MKNHLSRLILGGTAVAEVGGKEIIGTVGVQYHLLPNLDVFGSFSYDNADAKLSARDSLGSSKARG